MSSLTDEQIEIRKLAAENGRLKELTESLARYICKEFGIEEPKV